MVSSFGCDEARFVLERHRGHVRHEDIGSLKGDYFQKRPHPGSHLLAFRVEGLLHGSCVEGFHRRESFLFGYAEDDDAAVAVGEGGKRVGNAFGDFVARFLDFACLRIVPDFDNILSEKEKNVGQGFDYSL